MTSFASLYDILVVSFNAQNSSDKERHKTGVVVIRWHDSKMINKQKGHVNGESNFSQLFCMKKKKKKDEKAIKLSKCCGIIVIM